MNPYLNLNQIIAHRGASAYTPENTASAIKKAAQMGANWIEVDINISQDNTPVVFHDATLERCSNGKGKLTQSSDESLSELDFGSWFSKAFENEPLLTLKTLLDIALEYDLALNLEIKPEEDLELETVIAIKSCLDKYSTLPCIVFSSFSLKALELSQIHLSEYPRALLVEKIDDTCLSELKHFDACGLHFDGEKNDDETIATFVKAGIPLLAYTINQKSKAQHLLNLGVAAVFSDYPDLLDKGLDK